LHHEGTPMDLNVTWDPTKAETNQGKHGVSFGQAAGVLLDPLALTVFDEAHSEHEERWFTLGRSLSGQLLAVAHTYQVSGLTTASVRIISARAATRRERTQYESEPR
jgi:hypothetical protein